MFIVFVNKTTGRPAFPT